MGSRFAKPVARAALGAAGLFVFAFIGRMAEGSGRNATVDRATIPGALAGSVSPAAASAVAEPRIPGSGPVQSSVSVAPAQPPPALLVSRSRASPEDPVVLNTATVDDLRRLRGIGEKRANAILALRSKLGRLRAIEDLLKVKGIGRAMLKRLRPLVRLDPIAAQDAGAGPSVTPAAR
jgi:competence protein ComEA